MTFLLALLCAALPAAAQTRPPAWQGYAGNAQHTARAPAAGQPIATLHWQTPIDLAPQQSGGELLIHYGSPMITGANTLLLPVKTGATGGFRIEAHDGASGAELWQANTDFVLAPHDWTPSFPAQLTARNVLYFAGIGGTVYARGKPDSATGKLVQRAFYGIAAYRADRQAYQQSVMIDTPITSDAAGDIFFGFVVIGATPAKLQSGIARIGADGTGSWISASAAAGGDTSIAQVAMNCAPAISADESTVYIAVSGGTWGDLVGLDATTLQPKYKAALTDPSSGAPAWIDDDSSASPTIGPDGDVYYGVLENPFPDHDDRGWLLHFDATLATRKTPGSFGWDDTVSIVPSASVPSYTGTSPYLLMTKYNNYLGLGRFGNGHNRIAIIDPDKAEKDPFSGASVMRTVLSILGPTPFPGARGAVYEWCINSAVVDVATGTVVANSEDGHVYRWSLASNTLIQSFALNAPVPEAYTPTVIGPDGTVYAINNATLYALGQ
jgi:hypothetical protein